MVTIPTALIPAGSIVKVIDDRDSPFYNGQILRVLTNSYKDKDDEFIGFTQDIKTEEKFEEGWYVQRFKILKTGEYSKFDHFKRFKKIKKQLEKYRKFQKGGK